MPTKQWNCFSVQTVAALVRHWRRRIAVSSALGFNWGQRRWWEAIERCVSPTTLVSRPRWYVASAVLLFLNDFCFAPQLPRHWTYLYESRYYPIVLAVLAVKLSHRSFFKPICGSLSRLPTKLSSYWSYHLDYTNCLVITSTAFTSCWAPCWTLTIDFFFVLPNIFA